MSNQQYTVELRGCAPVPLASYLKALGILRLVAEQVDAEAHGWWERDIFWLRSKLDTAALVDFFASDYRPTPLVAPWNGGSGFFPKDNTTAIQKLVSAESVRFSNYRQAIASCRTILQTLSIDRKPDESMKSILLQSCRNSLPDEILPWLDAAYVLTDQGPKFPPIFGTGGNDGRLEFTNNFMQRICELFDCKTGSPLNGILSLLHESLFSRNSNRRTKAPIGQFDPGSVGGPNATTGHEDASRINLWDFVLSLEGGVALSAASVKRLESAESGQLAYPFCVRQIGTGYGSASSSDETSSRAEMWLPLWVSPASHNSVRTLLSEGRAEVSGRQVCNGVDFVRAISTLGVDRGINEFQRYAFQQRNGLSYLAVPLGRYPVRMKPSINGLLNPLDSWLNRFRRAATSKTAPGRAGRALHQLESTILDLCNFTRPTDALAVLIALGKAESAIASSPKMRESVQPIPLLKADWITQTYDGSVEYRLASAVASIWDEKVGPLRRHIEPVEPHSWTKTQPRWAQNSDDPAIVWGSGRLIKNLNAVLRRRLIDAIRLGKDGAAESTAPLKGRCSASLGDLRQFILGETDDERIDSLLRALILIDWQHVSMDIARQIHGPPEPIPDAAFALMRLCHLTGPVGETTVRLTPVISQRAMAGGSAAATQLASQRLRSSGWQPAVDVVSTSGDRMRRVSAAMMFPLDASSMHRLKRLVIRGDDSRNGGDSYDDQSLASRPERQQSTA